MRQNGVCRHGIPIENRCALCESGGKKEAAGVPPISPHQSASPPVKRERPAQVPKDNRTPAQELSDLYADHAKRLEAARLRDLRDLRKQAARDAADRALKAWVAVRTKAPSSREQPEGWGTEEREESFKLEQAETTEAAGYDLVEAYLAKVRLCNAAMRDLLLWVYYDGRDPSEFKPIDRQLDYIEYAVGADGEPLKGSDGKPLVDELGQPIELRRVYREDPMRMPTCFSAFGISVPVAMEQAVKRFVRGFTAFVEQSGLGSNN